MDADFVDGAIDAWAKVLPRLETSGIEITSRLDRVARHLERRVADALADSGLSGRDLDVLGALRRAGAPFGLPASDLARAAMLSSGGMTGQADRLANAGLVVRRPDPEDRRAVVVTLTAEGRGTVERAIKTYLNAVEKVLTVLDESERATLVELLRKLLVALEGGDPNAAQPEVEQASRKSKAKGQKATRARRRFEEGG